MKKLLLLNFFNLALAGGGIINTTAADVAAKCFPSGNFANAIGFNQSFYCRDDDTEMFFGRFTAYTYWPTEQALNVITRVTTDFHGVWQFNSRTAYHNIGNGSAWKLIFDPSHGTDICTIWGLASASVQCSLTCELPDTDGDC